MNRTSFQPAMFRPRRAASWWSRLPDLLWPEPRVRDAIRRRADALAEAGVDTAIQNGFHLRFDFTPYFGLLHGYLADVAETLHERNIRFLDHYTCNLIARPNSAEELNKYHRLHRHHVSIHPTSADGESLRYAGYRFNDLREVDVETGDPTYTWSYQSEMFCHTNPDFLAMHEAYLRRHLAEIPADGLQVDDLCRYAYFRACACRHCRERFARDYGRELPPFADKSFWGDTSKPPTEWGNYDNPAFRDWVLMRHRTHADHLALVRRIIGPDRILMTCCSHSGSLRMNSLGISYEHFIEPCDWVMLENNGLSVQTVHWSGAETDAMLHKAIAATKSPGRPAPSVACSYTFFQDSAYLGWAISRFWGVCNWSSTQFQGLETDPDPLPEDAELIAPFNRWEMDHELPEGDDVVEARIVFLRAMKETGWRDAQGRDHWTRVAQWAGALLKRNIGYRFVLTDELADAVRLAAENSPLILDGCAILTDSQRTALATFVRKGGKLIVVPPLDAKLEGPNVITMGADAVGAKGLEELVDKGIIAPRLRRVSGDAGRRLRLRRHGGRLVLHVLNESLEGVEHPTVYDSLSRCKVLHKIRSLATEEPLVVEIDATGLPWDWKTPAMFSPELSVSRPARVESLGRDRLRLTLDVRGVRLYAQVQENGNR
jgi:hypothetical protein